MSWPRRWPNDGLLGHGSMGSLTWRRSPCDSWLGKHHVAREHGQRHSNRRNSRIDRAPNVLAVVVLARRRRSVSSAMSCGLGCLSVRGGRSTGASHQSRPCRLPPRAAVASVFARRRRRTGRSGRTGASGRAFSHVCPNTALPQSPSKLALNSAPERPQTPYPPRFLAIWAARARTTEGGVGRFRANSASGQQNACKSVPSRPPSAVNRRGVQAT